jgi:hypothetical protein
MAKNYALARTPAIAMARQAAPFSPDHHNHAEVECYPAYWHQHAFQGFKLRFIDLSFLVIKEEQPDWRVFGVLKLPRCSTSALLVFTQTELDFRFSAPFLNNPNVCIS